MRIFLKIIISSSPLSLCLCLSVLTVPSKQLLLVLPIWPHEIFLREDTHMYILKIWWENCVVGGVGEETGAQNG